MARIQIQLIEPQLRKLKAISRQEGISVAEIIRRLIDRALDQQRPTRHHDCQRAAVLIGALRDQEDMRDLAERHGDYLDEASES